MAVTLPAELVDEIHVRLPVKSITRFELVCKEWHSKFHSTEFKEFYWQRSKNKTEPESKMMKLKDLFKVAPQLQHERRLIGGVKHRTKISVTGPSSNGIYCLTSIPVNDSIPWWCSIKLWECKIALCNPGIRQFKFLPPFPMRFCAELIHASRDWNRVVSGFDGTSCCFRVVVVISYGEVSFCSFLVFVYSSNSGKWKKLVDYKPGKEPVGPPSATHAFTRPIVHIVSPTEVCSQNLLNGCWHWVVQLLQHNTSSILSFNFAHQSFSLIKGPPTGFVYLSHLLGVDVFVLHGHLAIIHRNWDDEVSVWMMTDYGVKGSWTLKFKAISKHGLSMFRKLYSVDYLDLQVDAEGEGGCDNVYIKRLVFTRRERSCKNEIISLDYHGRHQVTRLHYNPNKDISFSTSGISSYRETLESLN